MTDPQFRVGFNLCLPDDSLPQGEVLLLHGLTSSPQEMEELASYLHQQGFNVSVPQLTGHAGSLREFKRVDAKRWLNDCQTAFQEMRNRNPDRKQYIVGVSFGALLALYLCETHHRDVTKAVVLSPPIRFKSPLRELILQLLSFLPDPFLDRLGVVKKIARRPNYLAVLHQSLPVHSLAASARLIQIRRVVKRQLKSVSCPLLIFQDPADHLLHPGAGEYLRNHVSSHDVKLNLVPGGEHELTLGHKRLEVFAQIEQFFRGENK